MAEEKPKRDVSKPKEGPKAVQLGGESLLDRLIPHIKKILVATMILAVLVTMFFGYRACSRSREAKSTEKVASVLDVAMRPVIPAAAGSAAKQDPDHPTFSDDKERADKVLDEMAKQGTDGSPGFRAAMLVDAGKLDEAIELYRTCDQGQGIENVLCREGLGIALETKAMGEKDPAAQQRLLGESLEAFLRMQPDDTGPRRAYALYHQGRLNQQLQKKAEAKALFEKVKGMNPPKELADLVERRLSQS